MAGESPSIVLIAFSGRCALTPCTPPDESEDALARALVPAAVAAWSVASLHVEGDPTRGRGYRAARADLEKAVQDGVLGPDSNTRLVLLGYAHGTQFARLLAFEHSGVAFTASVLGRLHWVGCDVLSIPGLIGHLADTRHQEVDEVGGAAFDAWVTWVLEVLRVE